MKVLAMQGWQLQVVKPHCNGCPDRRIGSQQRQGWQLQVVKPHCNGCPDRRIGSQQRQPRKEAAEKRGNSITPA